MSAQSGSNEKRSESNFDKSLAIISPCKKDRVTDSKMLNPNEKVVVTQQGIDNWRAQMYGLDIKNFPKIKPQGMPLDLYTELKKLYVVRTKIKASSKNPNDQDREKINLIDSRYMDWYKLYLSSQ